LNSEKLKTVALKGELMAVRCVHALPSYDDAGADRHAVSTSSSTENVSECGTVSENKYSNTAEGDKDEQCVASVVDSDSSALDDTIDVDDVVLVADLTSARVLELNGFYGKVGAARSNERWRVRTKNRTYWLKEANLVMGMKAVEMSDETRSCYFP
jgi:hypothetical protein